MGRTPCSPSSSGFSCWDLISRHIWSVICIITAFFQEWEAERERWGKKSSRPSNFPTSQGWAQTEFKFPSLERGKLGGCVTLLNWAHNSQAKFSSTAKLILFCSWINKVRKKKAGITHFWISTKSFKRHLFQEMFLNVMGGGNFIPSPNPASPQETLFRAALTPSFSGWLCFAQYLWILHWILCLCQ